LNDGQGEEKEKRRIGDDASNYCKVEIVVVVVGDVASG
jgi:hypothetical protein